MLTNLEQEYHSVGFANTMSKQVESRKMKFSEY